MGLPPTYLHAQKLEDVGKYSFPTLSDVLDITFNIVNQLIESLVDSSTEMTQGVIDDLKLYDPSLRIDTEVSQRKLGTQLKADHPHDPFYLVGSEAEHLVVFDRVGREMDAL